MRQLKISKSITNRDSNAVEKYLQEISKEELLTPAEEVDLAQRIRQGDAQALDKLVRGNLRFVVSVAKQYQNTSFQLNDLINEGNAGLVRAAYKFDETRGFKFISYAVWWIRQSILQAIAEHGRQVRLPLNKVGFNNKVLKAGQDFLAKYEREPSDEELAEIMNVELEEIVATQSTLGRHSSFDAPFENEDGVRSRYDAVKDENAIIPDENLSETESLKMDMSKVLNNISPKESEVLRLFFGIGVEHPMTLDDIGLMLDVSRERVRQIRERGINRLKKNSQAKKVLMKYLAPSN